MAEQQGVSAGFYGAGPVLRIPTFAKRASAAVPRFVTLSGFGFQVHRGIKGVIRDRESGEGIAGAVIKVEEIDHHIRSGGVSFT